MKWDMKKWSWSHVWKKCFVNNVRKSRKEKNKVERSSENFYFPGIPWTTACSFVL